MRNRLFYLPLLLLAVLTAVACSDDDPVPFRPLLPANGASAVHSITRLGSVEAGYDWQFTYADGRMQKATGVLRDPSNVIDQSFKYTSAFNYGAKSVGMTSSNGEKISLHLTEQGFISQMTVDRNVYTFQYNANGQLSQWSKLVFEQTLGQVQQYRSSATISYDDAGAFRQITYVGTDSRRTVLDFVNANQANVNGILPPTISLEMGCIGFEQLYYAGLLGKSSKLLVKSITYSHPDESSVAQTVTDFEYGYHDGNVTLCNYHTASGAVASVSYGY